MQSVTEMRPIFERKSVWGALLLTIWLVVMVFLFWVFQFQYVSHWVSFEGNRLPQPAEVRDTTVLHFVDVDCPCTKFSLPHIETVEDAFRDKKVVFRRVKPGDLSWQGAVPASPSVALFSQEGELMFFGPYTSGAICGDGDDLLGKALDQTIEQGLTTGQWVNQEAVGCFCPWPTSGEVI